MLRKPINAGSAKFFEHQIGYGTPQQTKRALQELCGLYRTGHRIVDNEQLRAIENAVNGLLFTRSSDEKIRRWALNAIAQFGREKYSLPGVLHMLEKYSDDPETAASAIAALFFITRDAQIHLKKHDSFSRDLVVLAALQRADIGLVDTSKTRINIEVASPEILKLALIVVGMGRAPEHIFHPRFVNGEIVKTLGRHDNNLVVQYSVWAITENSELNVKHLGIDLRDIEKQPTNVRAWIVRLVAVNPDEVRHGMDYIRLGIEDRESDVRLGTAIGLQNTYFDGLEPIVLDWCYQEEDGDVQQSIIDHMVRNDRKCPNYRDHILQFFEAERSNSTRRIRMEAMASGTPLFAEFKKMQFNEPDLFRRADLNSGGGINVTNKYEIKNIQAGAVAVGGTAINAGAVSNVHSIETIERLQGLLVRAHDISKTLEINSSIKDELETAIRNAQSDATAEKLGAVTALFEKAKRLLGPIAGVSSDISAIVGAIEAIRQSMN